MDQRDPPSDLYRRLVWTTVFRLVVITVLLMATAVLTFSERGFAGPVALQLYGFTAVVYSAIIAYVVSMRQLGEVGLLRLARIEVAGDLFMATYLLWLTGGAESVLGILFSFAVINAAILFKRRGAFATAAGASVAYVGASLAIQKGWVGPAAAYLAVRDLPAPRLVFNLFVNGAATFLVAALASYLAEQIRRTGERLTLAEEDLAALATLHENIVQSVSSGILTLSSDGRLTFINRTGEELLGRPLSADRGRLLAELLPAFWDAIAQTPVASGRGETMIETPRGPRSLGFATSGLGHEEGTVVVFQDLTELRQMEALAHRNERLAAIGAVAAGLAHEIRNPLASVSGSVELLANSIGADADAERLLKIVLKETDRLDALIRDFLVFARPAPPDRRYFDVRQVVQEVVEVFKHDPRAADREMLVQGEPLRISADESQLRQVILNLLVNAVQASPPGQPVTVAVGVDDEGRASIEVHDQGEGIDPATLPHIFDPFFTTKSRGTGLGLALVHRIIEGHGGHVDVTSDAETGTTFRIAIPLDSQAEDPQTLAS